MDNTRVTDTRCVQYMLQRSFVTNRSTHSHTKSTFGQHYSIFGQQYSTYYNLIALQGLYTDDIEGCEFSKKFRAETNGDMENLMACVGH